MGAKHLSDKGFWESPNRVEVRTETKEVSKLIDGHSVDFWYARAEAMKRKAIELLEERDVATKAALERRGVDAGLRAVIRYALNELRRVEPNNKLLDKKVRDRIFREFEQEEIKRIKADRKIEDWGPLVLSEEVHSSE